MKRNSLHFNQFSTAQLSEQESNTLSGGYKVIPHGPGSFGLVNWDEIDIRNIPVIQVVFDSSDKSSSRP